MTKHQDPVDVVIVGAGAAASVLAARLAEGGKSVLVLEAGPGRKLSDLYSSQIWARRLKWGAPYVANAGKGDIWFNFNAGHGYGGAAIHHYGFWPRFRPEDFQLHSLYGRGIDWPLSYDDLRPYYDRVQTEVGVSGDASLEKGRPPAAPYPLQPVPVFTQGEVIAKGFKALGLSTAPAPLAILTEPYKGRNPCLWDGWCDAGCPIGALANPLVTYLPRATKAGAKLQADSRVLRVLTDADGNRATGVEYVKDGQRHIQPARLVILAAFAIENPRILLNSATARHDKGLGNGNDLVGRYLMSHASVFVFGMFNEDMENYMGATGGQLISQDGFPKVKGDGAFGSHQWAIALALKPNDLLGIAMSRADLFGAELDSFMNKASRHLGNMVAICEDQSQAQNRVRLAAEKDAYGMPLAEVVYDASPEAKKLVEIAASEGKKIFKAAGASEAWHGPMGAQHIMGGAIMGNDPKTSVTNKFGALHGVANLFVAGPSLFPSTSSANVTFTVHALAERSADHILAEWNSLSKAS